MVEKVDCGRAGQKKVEKVKGMLIACEHLQEYLLGSKMQILNVIDLFMSFLLVCFWVVSTEDFLP